MNLAAFTNIRTAFSILVFLTIVTEILTGCGVIFIPERETLRIVAVILLEQD